MVALRSFTASVVLVLLMIPLGTLRAQQASEPRGNAERQRDGLIVRILHLMPPTFADELNLTAEQRNKIQQLEQDFKQKRRDVLTKTAIKIVSTLDILQEGSKQELAREHEEAPVLAVIHEITGALLEARRTRIGYEKKMLAVLTEAQKEQYAELKEHPLHERREQRLAAHGVGFAADRHLLSPQVQQRLHLTAEQKKKIEELREEFDTKFHNVLTEEQRKQYDDLSRGRRLEARPVGRKINDTKERPKDGQD